MTRKNSFPHGIDELTETFDCSVIWDLDIHPATKQECDVWAVGESPEPSAGLHGYHLTPYFFTKKALDRYCRSNVGKQQINDKAAALFPDWDKTACRFVDEAIQEPSCA